MVLLGNRDMQWQTQEVRIMQIQGTNRLYSKASATFGTIFFIKKSKRSGTNTPQDMALSLSPYISPLGAMGFVGSF